MSDSNPTPETPKTESGRCHGHHRRGRGRGLVKLLVLGGAIAAGFAFFAPEGFASGRGAACGFGPHRGAAFAVDWAMEKVDATDAQADSVEAIVNTLIADLEGMKPAREALRERAHAALLADPVDEAALEAVRKEALVAFDEASARVVDAAVQAAGELTPEQRKKLADAAERFHR